MQSFHVSWIALLAIFLAGSAHGSPIPTQITRYLGEHFDAAVLTLFDEVEQCYITTPNTGDVHFKPQDESTSKFEVLEPSDLVGCRIRVQDLNTDDVGIWTLNAVSTEGTRRSQSYNVTVNVSQEPDSSERTTTRDAYEDLDLEQNTTPIPEEEISPIPDGNIIDLDALTFNTEVGATHRVAIPYHDFVNTIRCYIVTPEGYRLNLDVNDIRGLEIFYDPNVACGANLTINDQTEVGQWFLISREIRFGSEHYERRLPFTIHVTEEVNAIPNAISVVENNFFFVRLEHSAPNPETCKLLRPDGSVFVNTETDLRYVDTCGFIVRRVNKTDNGTWRIEHGNRITYRALIQVTVLSNGAQGQDQNQDLTWIRDKPVDLILGSSDVIYCRVTDPRNFIMFEGFGRCIIYIPRVTDDHEGVWRMSVGITGRVLTEESTFRVQVVNGSPKAEVKTDVTSNKPTVTLSCSVSSPYPMTACKFRDPSGRILMSYPGVGEDRYTFHGDGSNLEDGVYTHDCGIQITDPLIRDLGIWRCAIETSEETYFGFLTAWCPWATRDPEVAAGIVTNPILTADRRQLDVIEGDSVLMSCSVQSAIRYCYFRASNGTVYNVGPEFSSTDMAEYAGAGLDGGECSIRFRSLTRADSRGWSCHVGFFGHRPEQRANFDVNVNDLMLVTQMDNSISVVVEGRRPIDYCRFVRIDGFGFTNDDVEQDSYLVVTTLNHGECTLWTLESSMLDRHPWTVAVRITGHSQEITRTTGGSLVMPQPEGIVTHRMQSLWLVFLVTGIILIVLAAVIIPKRNRNWTYAKAASIRNSFRHRFVKKAAVDSNTNEKNTANAA